METITYVRVKGQSELSGMLATLCLYDNWLGPYHPQTLRLMAQVANACWQAGAVSYAQPLLERAVRDIGRYLGQDHELRLGAIAALRDLLTAEGDYERADSLQTELQRREKCAVAQQ